MSKKQTHPDLELFDFLNGTVDRNDAQAIEAHLSACEDCASIASIVGVLKESASASTNPGQYQVSSPTIGDHPDISKLASFFYAQSKSTEASRVKSHIALCSSCAEAIAEYARAERAAARYKPARNALGEVSAKAWELIRDWEESSFGKLKPADEVLGQPLLDRLRSLLNEGAAPEASHARSEYAERVPVLIISSSGEMRSLEYFDKTVDQTGASVLRHAEGSARFDNKPVHALFDIEQNGPFVISNLIRRDSVRIEPARPGEESRRADYIIIED